MEQQQTTMEVLVIANEFQNTVVNIADLSFQSYLKFLTFLFCPIIVKLKTKFNETKRTLILRGRIP